MGRIRGLDKAASEASGRSLIDRLGLLPSPHVPIDSLSKGNKQKVVIAQAFIAPVEMIVLDEPCAGLDAQARGALAELIDEQRTRGAAVLMSSHAPPADSLDDHVLRISDGQLCQMPIPSEARVDEDELGRSHVALTPTGLCSPSEEILLLPGVLSGAYDESRKLLELLVQATDIDDLLHEAIAAGWSVLSVAPLPPDGRSR